MQTAGGSSRDSKISFFATTFCWLAMCPLKNQQKKPGCVPGRFPNKATSRSAQVASAASIQNNGRLRRSSESPLMLAAQEIKTAFFPTKGDLKNSSKCEKHAKHKSSCRFFIVYKSKVLQIYNFNGSKWEFLVGASNSKLIKKLTRSIGLHNQQGREEQIVLVSVVLRS